MSHAPFHVGPRHDAQPLRGFFTALGHALRFVFGGFLAWLFHHVLVKMGHVFTVGLGPWWPVVAAVLALAAGLFVALVLLRRRTRVERQDRDVRDAEPGVTPLELEQRAERALANGEYELAVRYWFRSGVTRLSQRGFVANGESRTTRDLLRSVASPTLEVLTKNHERIAYGRQPATVGDATQARDGWPHVLDEAVLRADERQQLVAP